MAERSYVVGVGMTAFVQPGSRSWDYPEMAKQAVEDALADAGVGYDEVEQAVVGFVDAKSTAGQRALYEVGMTGLPVSNVNNNCASGSTALFQARQLVRGGMADCVLALGFEKMKRGPIDLDDEDLEPPLAPHQALMEKARGLTDAPMAAQYYGNAGLEHMERYGTTEEQLASVAVKNHRHSVANPRAQFQTAYSLDEVLSSRQIFGPLTLLQCSPPSEGAAAALVVSERFVRSHDLGAKAVSIVGQAMATDRSSTFDGSMINLVGADVSSLASHRALDEAGVDVTEIDVIELHDCFSPNEVITYEALGLCPVGDGGRYVESGATTFGGEVVVNPSGGLISKGHPLGATGLAQCAELSWQLRGEAGARQVPEARVGLQHNIGLGGAAVVTVYRGPEG